MYSLTIHVLSFTALLTPQFHMVLHLMNCPNNLDFYLLGKSFNLKLKSNTLKLLFKFEQCKVTFFQLRTKFVLTHVLNIVLRFSKKES